MAEGSWKPGFGVIHGGERGLNAEPRAKAGRGRGSLSISIVAMESRVTHPKEPVISKGGCRDYGPVTGNAPGALNPESCVSRKVMDSLGGEPVA